MPAFLVRDGTHSLTGDRVGWDTQCIPCGWCLWWHWGSREQLLPVLAAVHLCPVLAQACGFYPAPPSPLKQGFSKINKREDCKGPSPLYCPITQLCHCHSGMGRWDILKPVSEQTLNVACLSWLSDAPGLGVQECRSTPVIKQKGPPSSALASLAQSRARNLPWGKVL